MEYSYEKQFKKVKPQIRDTSRDEMIEFEG